MNNPPPDSARPERVLDVVAEVLEHAPGERPAFLLAACDGDEPLRAEVQSLLDQEAGAKLLLSTPVFAPDGGRLFGSDPGELQPGDTLGDCRIVRFLGEGGTGEVYLAQDTRLERPVAVKLLKRQFDDGLLLRRFHHERRVLAGLTHPNIARLYGGATTPEGRSYLVMEYVEGERLDRYCDAQGLDVTGRLELFRKVCAAVAYAHQNLVVHRDLKPANVRVTAEGEPKLLDFGIAKLLETEATAPESDPTMTMQGMLTPEYASPEQLRGEAITTASDVYSLGVVLYELLTGQRPYSVSSRRPDELARAICERDPPRPSTVAGRGRWTEIATSTGGETPARLRRRLEGDLDNIVAVALRKEPTRRYASVPQFADDVRRHREGLPVLARKDTLGYRASKFVRRNRTGVTAAAFVVLALVAGLIIAAWQAHVARLALDRAQLAQKQEERLNGFLQTLLGSANPENGLGRDLKVIQVLDQASTNLDHELAGEPALLAQAHVTIGQAYAGLREEAPCMTHLRAALEIDRRIYGEENIVTARVKAVLGAALRDQSRRYSEAEPLLRQALAVERRQPPGEQGELAFILQNEGLALSHLGRSDDAKAMVAEYLTFIRAKGGEQGMAYADGLLQMANLSLAHQDAAAAEAPLRGAVAIYRQLRPHAPSFAGMLTNLAYVLILQGKLAEPEGILREAQELYRSTVGEESTSYGMNVGCLSWLYFLRGEYAKAEAEMSVAAVIARNSQTPEGEQDYVGGRVLLALAITRQGRPVEAEPELRDCLRLAKTNRLVGNALPEAVSGALGECLLAQNRYAEAEPLLLAEYAHLRASPLDKAARLTDPVRRLYDLYIAWNKPAEAARFSPDGAARDSIRP